MQELVIKCKNAAAAAAAAAATDDDDDDYIFSSSSNYLQDFNQSKLFTMIIIMKKESELQE